MTVRELIDILEDYDGDIQVFTIRPDMHDPEVTLYDMDNIPNIVVIS